MTSIITLSDNNNILFSASGNECGAAFLCIFGNAPTHYTKDSKNVVITTPDEEVPPPLSRRYKIEFQVPEKFSKL